MATTIRSNVFVSMTQLSLWFLFSEVLAVPFVCTAIMLSFCAHGVRAPFVNFDFSPAFAVEVSPKCYTSFYEKLLCGQYGRCVVPNGYHRKIKKYEAQGLCEVVQAKGFESFLERVAVLCYGLQRSNDSIVRFCLLHQFVTAYFKHSSRELVWQYFRDLFSDVVEQESSPLLEAQSLDLDDVSAFFDYFRMVKRSELTKRLFQFAGLLTAVFFCEKGKSMSFTWHGFEMFKVIAAKNVNNASDLFETFVETTLILCRKGAQFFHERDFSSLFSDVDYDDEYAFVCSKLAMLETGNLDLVDCSEQEFMNRLSRLREKTVQSIKRSRDSQLKNLFAAKLVKLDDIDAKVKMCLKTMRLRVKPFSILLFGKTSVSKTRLCNLLCSFILKKNRFASQRDNVVTINSNDRYQSDYLPRHSAVIFDDLCNAKAPFVEGNPINQLITFINNVQTAAVKADVAGKGNVMIRPKVAIATTNVKDLESTKYSNEPVSVMRRFNYVITVNVAECFRMNDSHMLDPGKTDPSDYLQDVWRLTVQRVIPCNVTGLQPDSIGYKPVVFNGNELTDVKLDKILPFLAQVSRLHFEQQEKLVAADSELYDDEVCPHDTFRSICEMCPFEDFQQNYFAQGSATRVLKYFAVARMFHWFCNCCFLNRFLSERFFRYQTRCVRLSILKDMLCYLTSSLFVWFSPMGIMYASIVYVISTYTLFFTVAKRIDSKFSHYYASMPRMCENIRQWHLNDSKKMIVCGVAVTTIIAICSVYLHKKKFTTNSSECTVPSPDDIQHDNVWKKCPKVPVPTSSKAKTTSAKQLVDMIGRRIGNAKVEAEGQLKRCDIFPLFSNVWVLPSHVCPEEFSISVVRQSMDVVGTNFRSTVTKHNMIRDVGLDLCFVCLPEGGENKDFRPYFVSELSSVPRAGTLVYKDKDAAVENFLATGECISRIETDKSRFLGVTYKLDRESFKGLCMAPFVVDTKSPYIAGFHLAGKQYHGASGIVTNRDVDRNVQALAKLPGVQLCTSDGDFPKGKYGVDYGSLGEAHVKSPVNFLDDHSVVRYFGAHSLGRRTFRSNVVRTCISDLVQKQGIPIKHGPSPKINSYIHWQRHLAAMTDCQVKFDRNILGSAYADFRKTVFTFLEEHQELKSKIHPLTKESTLFGADGVYGIDSINFATSVGWPLNIPKSKFLGEVAPVEGVSANRVFDEKFLVEAQRMEECFLRGERCYAVQRANLKDTPTKLTSEKVRVFAGSELAFLILVRKYYLTICKLIMENKYLFECAVGINAHGPEWTQLTRHVRRYGDTRVIAGDYKHYDANMSPNITLMSMRLLRDIAEWAGYSPDQLKIMDGVATEICYPLYEYNGDFISVFGSNPSGQPLTVYLNNIANSLYLRYAYYAIYGVSFQVPFQDVVSVMCYGDDNIMSVKDGYKEFNHTSVATQLAKVGITYTMADKESESIPYIHADQANFLKRSAVWVEDLKQYFAPLETDSIEKGLHVHLASKVLTEKEYAAEAIENSLQEWFFHGEELYRKRKEQMEQVAHAAEIHHFVRWVSYETAMVAYCEKYLLCEVGESH